jgi:hypothetical protein
MVPPWSIQRASVHESGHAVAAFNFWLPVREVLIRADGSGGVTYSRRIGLGEVACSAVVAYARPEAEVDRFGSSPIEGELTRISKTVDRLGHRSSRP